MILCISHSGDYYTIDLVMAHLQKLGKEVVRLDTDRFNDTIRFEYSSSNGKPEVLVHTGETTIHSEQIEAVWYRKLWDLHTPAELAPEYHSIFFQEYHSMRNLFFHALEHLPWMNPMRQDHFVGNDKLLQLTTAQACGITIPQTLFTNDAAKVSVFFHEVCQGEMIAKLHGTLSRSMNGDQPSLPTTRIEASDLDELDTLIYCPMIFQRLIPKAYELRVIYIDGVYYAGKINAQHSVKGAVDWRFANDVQLSWEPYTLPEAVCAQLTALMHQLKLVFGAMDIICDVHGNYVFLEVNPQGEWGMLQRDLGYPIAETIAEKLVQMIDSRLHATNHTKLNSTLH